MSYINIFQKFEDNPDQFMFVVTKCFDLVQNNPSILFYILSYAAKHSNYASCVSFVNNINVSNLIPKKKTTYSYQKISFTKIEKKLNIISPLLSKEKIEYLCSVLYNQISDYYNYSITKIISFILENSSSFDLASSILEKNKKQLSLEHVQKIYNKFPELKDKIKNDPKFYLIGLSNDDISKPEWREKLINLFATNIKMLKFFPAQLELTIDDLQKLPPVKRLKFFQTYYGLPFKICHSYNKKAFYFYWGLDKYDSRSKKEQNHLKNVLNHQLNKKGKFRYSKLKMNFSPEQLHPLLFSVSIKKNEEVSKWLERYKIYYNAINKKD